MPDLLFIGAGVRVAGLRQPVLSQDVSQLGQQLSLGFEPVALRSDIQVLNSLVNPLSE